MLDNLRRHDVGYITFNLSSEWMVKRIKKMLIDGIDTWAPVNVKREIVYDPTPAIGAYFHADLLSAHEILVIRHAINEQRGELIVIVTPVRQRQHVEQCFAAAKIAKWLPSSDFGSYRSPMEEFKLISVKEMGKVLLEEFKQGDENEDSLRKKSAFAAGLYNVASQKYNESSHSRYQ
ncbi:hypothetical protein Tco_0989299 [Tanacetum coccineum]|uniref:Uncharacterized protein n=1 Tax=Tanacetum coccineum TaxID=301880 RepID=A0ABQ5ETL8_9ASTR